MKDSGVLSKCVIAFAIAAASLLILPPANTHAQQEKKQIVANKQYGFSFECPASWSVERTHFSDPTPDLEAFKAGNVGISGSFGKPAEGETNGVRLNAVKPSREEGDPLPPPTVEVHAHPASAKSCDEFTKEFKELLKMFGQNLVSAKTITTANKLEGCDYVYTMQAGPREIFSRMTVFFKHGKRYHLFYFEQSEDDFLANANAFEGVLNSLTITQ